MGWLPFEGGVRDVQCCVNDGSQWQRGRAGIRRVPLLWRLLLPGRLPRLQWGVSWMSRRYVPWLSRLGLPRLPWLGLPWLSWPFPLLWLLRWRGRCQLRWTLRGRSGLRGFHSAPGEEDARRQEEENRSRSRCP